MGLTIDLVVVSVCVVVASAELYSRIKIKESPERVFSGECCGAGCSSSSQGPYYYRYLQPSTRNTSVIYVGAMNFLMKMDIGDLSSCNLKSLEAETDTKKRCTIQGQKDRPDCQNHIRVIMEMQANQVYVCGSGAYSPKTYTLKEVTLNINTTEKGDGICPYDPMDNSTSVLISKGNPGGQVVPYFATYADFLKNNPKIFRPSFTDGSTTYAEESTDQEDDEWLKSPQFVQSFDGDKEVFFFLRETALETPPGSPPKVYSRVAKVCKGDLGVGFMVKKKWLSFVKARLNCSLPGSVPYEFDELYDISRVGNLFYGLFFRQAADLNASAICVFTLDDIQASFSGKFKHKTNLNTWETLDIDPNPRLDDCTAHETRPNSDFENQVPMYFLMDTNIDSVHKRPIFYKHGVQLMKIITGEKIGDSRNIYVASDKGEVYDIYEKDHPRHPMEPTVVLNAIYEPFQQVHPIWDMKLVGHEIFLGTDYQVGKLDLNAMCYELKKIDSCIYNTRCTWCNTSYSCLKATDPCSEPYNHTRIQHGESLLTSLENSGYVFKPNSDQDLEAISGLFQRLSLNVPYRVSEVVWKKGPAKRSKRNVDDSMPLLSSEKYAKTSQGDLIISNLTLEDTGRYTAFDMKTNRELTSYVLKVVDGQDNNELVKLWKQQFNDWSSSYKHWKDCASNYLSTCSGGNN